MDSKVLESLMIPEYEIANEGFGSKIHSAFNTIFKAIHTFINLVITTINKCIAKLKQKQSTKEPTFNNKKDYKTNELPNYDNNYFTDVQNTIVNKNSNSDNLINKNDLAKKFYSKLNDIINTIYHITTTNSIMLNASSFIIHPNFPNNDTVDITYDLMVPFNEAKDDIEKYTKEINEKTEALNGTNDNNYLLVSNKNILINELQKIKMSLEKNDSECKKLEAGLNKANISDMNIINDLNKGFSKVASAINISNSAITKMNMLIDNAILI